MTSISDRTYLDARIVAIIPAPAPLVADGDIYVGYALCEFDIEDLGEKHTERDILPFGTDGSIIGGPNEMHYHLNGLGDYDRPFFARFAHSDDDVFREPA